MSIFPNGMLTYKKLRVSKGFTIVELLISMGILLVIIALVSGTFTNIVGQAGKETRLSQREIEFLVNLEHLKMDLENIGYGLPWSYASPLSTYDEAIASTLCGGNGVNPASFNDTGTAPPRPISGADNRCVNQSDYLVVKATNIARNSASQKWTHLDSTGPYLWGMDDFEANDRVILILPKAGESTVRQLITSNGPFSFKYSEEQNHRPDQEQIRYIMYGIDPNTNPRVPFNRADYYISTSNVPSDCAQGTGVLIKAILNHSNGGFNSLPLLNCIADFQVIMGWDTNEDGTLDTYSSPDVTAGTSQFSNPDVIRNRLKEVRVYLLTHDGKMDRNYTYPNSTITVGEFGLGKVFDLTQINNYQNYRWKVLTLSVRPRNLKS
jgi:prepilin-type N-terminal cleavage/methylation domain-containing protein